MRLTLLTALCSLAVCHSAAAAPEFSDPKVFESRDGVLDLLLIARPQAISLGEFSPSAWIYEICRRTDSAGDSCQSGSLQSYAGARLQLQPGDHLKVRLVNRLPPAPAECKHVTDMPGMLAANPTNLHTHGLIVEPRQAGDGDPTYGDYVYVYGYPAGTRPGMIHPGLEWTNKPIDYDIYIPRNHPAGLFWFHPHVHGLSLNQISAGLSGILTIGSPDDEIAEDAQVRHLMLRDFQVGPNGQTITQEDPDFCDAEPSSHSGPERAGFCPGHDDGDDHLHAGGKWFFTVNGQVYPQATVKHPRGELWRLVNGSGSKSYDLALEDDATHQPLPMQLVSIDGVAIEATTGESIAQKLAGKAMLVPCPRGGAHALCAVRLRMMPSARAEIFVQRPDRSVSAATLVSHSFNTGPAGDTWPAANLMHVTFDDAANPFAPVAVKGAVSRTLSEAGALGNAARMQFAGASRPLPPDLARRLATGVLAPGAVSRADVLDDDVLLAQLRALKPPHLKTMTQHLEAAAGDDCKTLPADHRRRIFFGLPADNPNAFGLGYEEIDANGKPVPGTFQDIKEFDHIGVSVCLPLGPGNRAVTERWQLVNVAGEDHNFHIHQTKFRVLPRNAPAGDAGLLMDNVPVPHGSDACDGTVATWRSGTCAVAPVEVAIPFSQLGDFVYHCHILEHEDGGMMAHIRVVTHHD